MISVVLAFLGAYQPLNEAGFRPQRQPTNLFYDKALTITDSKGFGDYSRWWRASPLRRRTQDLPIPKGVKQSDSLVVVAQKWTRQYGNVLQLVRKGNASLAGQMPIDPIKGFFGGRRYTRLAYFEAAASSADFARKDFEGGARHIVDGFKLGENISYPTLAARMVGLGCEGIALNGVQDHLNEIDGAGARLLVNEIDIFLKKKPVIIAALKDAKQKDDRDSLHNMIAGRKGLKTVDFQDGRQQIALKLAGYSDDEARSLSVRALAYFHRLYDKAIRTFEGPESGWVRFTDVSREPVNDDDVIGWLSGICLPEFRPMFDAEEKLRTKLRLIRLAAKAAIYRSRTGHVPRRLEDFTDVSDRNDPATGQRFVYSVTAGNFKLTGPIKGLVAD